MINSRHTYFFQFLWETLFSLYPGLRGCSNFKSSLEKPSDKCQMNHIIPTGEGWSRGLVENSNRFSFLTPSLRIANLSYFLFIIIIIKVLVKREDPLEMLYSHIFIISQYIGQTIFPEDKNLANQILTIRKVFSSCFIKDDLQRCSLE